jgi:hypothetical protein
MYLMSDLLGKQNMIPVTMWWLQKLGETGSM